MDLLEIKEFIKDFEESSLNSVELEIEGMKLKLNKQSEVDTVGPEVVQELREVKDVRKKPSLPKETEHKKQQVKDSNVQFTPVKSPLVGTYYSAPSPDDDPFVRIGQQVKKGQVLCIIEAMKIMNEITSPIDGIVRDIHIENGDTVGFEQLILSIE